MVKIILILLILCTVIKAQDTDSTTYIDTDSIPVAPVYSQEPSRVFYGGNVSFSFFNDYFYLGLYPMIGYKLTDKLYGGVRFGYAYINDSRLDPSLSSHNYGGGVFALYRLIQQLYLKTEYIYFSWEHAVNFRLNGYDTERVGIPFWLVGAGYNYYLNRSTSLFIEVMFDVLQDDNSPFEDWDPMISFGVGVGF